MESIMNTTKGLGLIVNMNWDRLLYVATLLVALGIGAWLGTMMNDALLVPMRTP